MAITPLVLYGRLVTFDPERPVIVLYGGEPNGFSPRALAAGAEDVVALPEGAEPPGPAERERVAGEIMLALEKAVARRRR